MVYTLDFIKSGVKLLTHSQTSMVQHNDTQHQNTAHPKTVI